MNFNDIYKNKIKFIDDYIKNYLESRYPEVSPVLLDSMKYSVLNGGKRLRSILCIEICKMLDGDINKALPFAAGIEFIHAYSLVHDDLPAMDNSDYRRGQLSCHKKFGEAFGILCGDALLNSAYEIMANNCTTQYQIKAMQCIAKCAGAHGMIDGQIIDLSIADTGIYDEKQFIKLIELKTANLIKAAVVSGVLIAEGSEDTLNEMESFAYNLGLAFQIRDDFEDVTEDDKKISDSPNFVSYFGSDIARKMLNQYYGNSINILKKYKTSQFLCGLLCYLFE